VCKQSDRQTFVKKNLSLTIMSQGCWNLVSQTLAQMHHRGITKIKDSCEGETKIAPPRPEGKKSKKKDEDNRITLFYERRRFVISFKDF